MTDGDTTEDGASSPDTRTTPDAWTSIDDGPAAVDTAWHNCVARAADAGTCAYIDKLYVGPAGSPSWSCADAPARVEVRPGAKLNATIAGFYFSPGDLYKQDIRFTLAGDPSAKLDGRVTETGGLDEILTYQTPVSPWNATITATLHDAAGAPVCARSIEIVTVGG